jgi:hypothetical protein
MSSVMEAARLLKGALDPICKLGQSLGITSTTGLAGSSIILRTVHFVSDAV